MKKLIISLSVGMLLGSAATALAATNETVQATFAKFVFKVNGQEKELKTAPLVVDGTSYLPVREISGLLGYELKYDEETRTINLDKNPKGDDKMPSTEINQNLVNNRALLDFIADKYQMKHKDGLSLSVNPDDMSEGSLNFKGEKYPIKITKDGQVDVSPLLEKGIITAQDLEKLQ
ncbi:copper amine oxidase N-terminal domain-containing protein [Paenibacillus ehimensis]|uniref:copper amine oxidase N-terminal domain-containing protein n=1 Tax=Paenibacillus ehimensis TaxID=79264 RepID=UPI000472B0F2|nr:copper amine oxidase N-terminal domain-containing protein [Paenibacillus ehimensis]